MGKLLPVERGFTPYGYVCDNLAAVRTEYLAESKRFGSGGAEGMRRLQRLLTVFEVLGALRDGFEANGWKDGGVHGKDTRVLVNQR